MDNCIGTTRSLNDGLDNFDPAPASPAESTDSVRGWDSFDQQVAWIGVRLLRLATGRWPDQPYRQSPEVLTEVSDTYGGEDPERMRRLCQGYLLMAHGHVEAARHEFDELLQTHTSPDREPFWNVALEAHAACLRRLGYETEALTEYLYLLQQSVHPDTGGSNLDRCARFYGLARSLATLQSRC